MPALQKEEEGLGSRENKSLSNAERVSEKWSGMAQLRVGKTVWKWQMKERSWAAMKKLTGKAIQEMRQGADAPWL